jgi:hypothetical protein
MYIPQSRPFVSSQGLDFAMIVPWTDTLNESAVYRVTFLWAPGRAIDTALCEEVHQEMLGRKVLLDAKVGG